MAITQLVVAGYLRWNLFSKKSRYATAKYCLARFEDLEPWPSAHMTEDEFAALPRKSASDNANSGITDKFPILPNISLRRIVGLHIAQAVLYYTLCSD